MTRKPELTAEQQEVQQGDQLTLRQMFYQFMLFCIGVVALGLLITAVLSYLVLLASPLLVDRYSQYLPTLQQHRKLALVAFIVLCFGLHQLRTRVLLAYAIVEIVGGLALGWNALSNTYPEGLVFWGALMGAVYLLVRGFDNLWLTLKSNWDKVGKSPKNMNEAVNDAVQRLLRDDLLNYYLKPDAKTFREVRGCEIVDTSVRLNPTMHQVKVKARRIKQEKDSESEAKYDALRKSGTLGYR